MLERQVNRAEWPWFTSLVQIPRHCPLLVTIPLGNEGRFSRAMAWGNRTYSMEEKIREGCRGCSLRGLSCEREGSFPWWLQTRNEEGTYKEANLAPCE